MFLRSDFGQDQGGGAAALDFGRVAPGVSPGALGRLRDRIDATDWTPDLGARIGSRDWWRGLVTCTALIAAAAWITPGVRPIAGAAPAPLSGASWDEARAQSFGPIAWGSNSGRRMAATRLVRALAETPERPIIELSATLGSGDDVAGVLHRAGVSEAEADRTVGLIGRTVPLGDLNPGTQIELTLGRHAKKTDPRPIEAMRFRARFDLNVAVARVGEALVVTPQPIAIDHTPLRIRGLVGQSLYRSARAAGAPAKAVEAYIRALAGRLSIGRDIGPDNVFDLTVAQDRAATGEVRLGELLAAGIDRDDGALHLFRWREDGNSGWFDLNGTGERRGDMAMPVDGHLTSGYGMRFHPIRHVERFHEGLDIGAPYGAPIRAATDGTVVFAGRAGGYGNFVKIAHAGGLVSGYGHMSRIAVRVGMRVAQGQQIGNVGSTGLSTGPHLHYQLWRNGATINPRTIAFETVRRLTGQALRAFRAYADNLLALKPATR